MEGKNDEHVRPTGGVFLTRRQFIRICALGLTSAICVSLSIRYSGDMTTLGLDIETNAIFIKKLSIVSHLFSFSSWFGCSIWISFIGGFVMFNNLPRHVFGKLQSKMFPRYFQFSLIMTILSVSSRIIWVIVNTKLNKEEESFLSMNLTDILKKYQTEVILYLTVLGCMCANLFYLEPKTTETMFKRHVIERKLGTGNEVGALRPTDPKILEAYNKNEELKQINKKFGILHGLSATLNLIALCLGIPHIWWLAGHF